MSLWAHVIVNGRAKMVFSVNRYSVSPNFRRYMHLPTSSNALGRYPAESCGKTSTKSCQKHPLSYKTAAACDSSRTGKHDFLRRVPSQNLRGQDIGGWTDPE